MTKLSFLAVHFLLVRVTVTTASANNVRPQSGVVPQVKVAGGDTVIVLVFLLVNPLLSVTVSPTVYTVRSVTL
jgi:hypothetical protein